MSAVSKNVTPASSAACTTASVARSSIRRPKLLHPSPTTDTWREPIARFCMSPWALSGCLAEPLETIRHLGSAIAFVRELRHQQREWLEVAGDVQRPCVERIEAHVADQAHGDPLGARIVATEEQRGPILPAPRLEHVEQDFARDGAERGDEMAPAQAPGEHLRARRGVCHHEALVVDAHGQ